MDIFHALYNQNHLLLYETYLRISSLLLAHILYPKTMDHSANYHDLFLAMVCIFHILNYSLATLFQTLSINYLLLLNYNEIDTIPSFSVLASHVLRVRFRDSVHWVITVPQPDDSNILFYA